MLVPQGVHTLKCAITSLQAAVNGDWEVSEGKNQFVDKVGMVREALPCRHRFWVGTSLVRTKLPYKSFCAHDQITKGGIELQ